MTAHAEHHLACRVASPEILHVITMRVMATAASQIHPFASRILLPLHGVRPAAHATDNMFFIIKIRMTALAGLIDRLMQLELIIGGMRAVADGTEPCAYGAMDKLVAVKLLPHVIMTHETEVHILHFDTEAPCSSLS